MFQQLKIKKYILILPWQTEFENFTKFRFHCRQLKNCKIQLVFNNPINTGVILGYNWVWFPDAAFDDLFFFKNLFYENNCKEVMNIEAGQIVGALLTLLQWKSALLVSFGTLSSVSKIIPDI